jgi:hypothetical protein
VRSASESRKKALRRHTELAGHLFLVHSSAFIRRRFSSVVTTTLAIIRLKSRLAKRSNAKKCKEAPIQESRPPTPTPILVHCNLCNRNHDLSDAPDVVRVYLPCLSSILSHSVKISLSPCTKDQRTWEASTRKGKGMTVVRCFPCIFERIDQIDQLGANFRK